MSQQMESSARKALYVATAFLCLPSFSPGLGHWVGSLLPFSPWFPFFGFPSSCLPFSSSLLGPLRGHLPRPHPRPPADLSFAHRPASPAVPGAAPGFGSLFETRAPAFLKSGLECPARSGLERAKSARFRQSQGIKRGATPGRGGSSRQGWRSGEVPRARERARGGS